MKRKESNVIMLNNMLLFIAGAILGFLFGSLLGVSDDE